MTLEEFFSKTVKHLLSQKRRSVKGRKTIAIHGDNNLKSAIGCHIPTELYKQEMEGKLKCNKNNPWPPEHFPELKPYFPDGTTLARRVLGNLERMHNRFDPSQWEMHSKLIKQKFYIGESDD